MASLRYMLAQQPEPILQCNCHMLPAAASTGNTCASGVLSSSGQRLVGGVGQCGMTTVQLFVPLPTCCVCLCLPLHVQAKTDWMQCCDSCKHAALCLGLVLLLTCVLDAHACGGHGTPAWQKTFEVQGRRRSLLSFKARRCVCPRLQLSFKATHNLFLPY